VSNYGSNNVTKLSLTGTNLGNFAVGNNPIGVAFDGAFIWVANQFFCCSTGSFKTVEKKSEGRARPAVEQNVRPFR